MPSRGEVWYVVSTGDPVIHIAAREQLSTLIIMNIFHQCLTDALDNAAMDLPFCQQWVEDHADVVDHCITVKADLKDLMDLDDFGAYPIYVRLVRFIGLADSQGLSNCYP